MSHQLQPHQQDAFNDMIGGFEEHNRGKLIMACGPRTVAVDSISRRIMRVQMVSPS